MTYNFIKDIETAETVEEFEKLLPVVGRKPKLKIGEVYMVASRFFVVETDASGVNVLSSERNKSNKLLSVFDFEPKRLVMDVDDLFVPTMMIKFKYDIVEYAPYNKNNNHVGFVCYNITQGKHFLITASGDLYERLCSHYVVSLSYELNIW